MVSAVEKLKRLRTQLSGQTDDIQQPYEFTCGCGEVVRGMRRPTWIEVECPSCCESHFLLPHNVYPSTQAVHSEVLGGTFKERLTVIVGDLLPARSTKTESSESDDTAAIAEQQTKSDVDSLKGGSTADGEHPPPKLSLRRRLVPQINLKAVAARTFTPFRLLMLAMIAVVGLTIYWSGFQQAVEQAQQDWLAAEEEITQHLNAADFHNLQITLQKAVAAGEVLDRSDAEWRLRLNLLSETEAVLNMSGDNLLMAFHAAYDQNRSLKAEASGLVSTTAQTGYFVFDSYLSDFTEDIPTVQFPATPGQHSVHLFAPFPELKQLAGLSSDARIICAARIADVRPPTSTEPMWQVLLNPTDFVLLTSQQHCESVGLTVAEDRTLAAALERQRDFVSQSKSWADRQQAVRIPKSFRNESP